MELKIRLLLSGRGVQGPSLIPVLERERARCDTAFPGGLKFLLGARHYDAELVTVAAAAFDPGPQEWDAMMEIVVQDAMLLPGLKTALGGLADRLGPSVEASHSTVMVGTEHTVIPGDGPFFVLIANRRLPHLNHEQFLRKWFDFHAPFSVKNVPPEVAMFYRQFHNEPDEAAALAGRLGLAPSDFDGAAECYYRDVQALHDLMGRTAIVDAATEDERTFVDHHGCVVALFDLIRP